MLADYHGEGDQNSPIVQLEYREMLRDISRTGSDKRWWDYHELFNTRESRYRTMVIFFIGKSVFSFSRILLLKKQNTSNLSCIRRAGPNYILLSTNASRCWDHQSGHRVAPSGHKRNYWSSVHHSGCNFDRSP